MKRRAIALAAILAILLAVVVRGRGGGPIPLAAAVRAATNGSFYHWRDVAVGPATGLRAEGWCAFRRSRTLTYQAGRLVEETRRSPSGVYRSIGGRPSFEPRSDIVGMEEGDDFLTRAATRLGGLATLLKPLGGDRWQRGAATFGIEPGGVRIRRIDAPGERIEIDYPPALPSDLFEAPR